jgi:hypothetical protein
LAKLYEGRSELLECQPRALLHFKMRDFGGFPQCNTCPACSSSVAMPARRTRSPSPCRTKTMLISRRRGLSNPETIGCYLPSFDPALNAPCLPELPRGRPGRRPAVRRRGGNSILPLSIHTICSFGWLCGSTWTPPPMLHHTVIPRWPERRRRLTFPLICSSERRRMCRSPPVSA